MNYTIDHFISKFQAIPDEQWGIGSGLFAGDGQKCALRHCGAELLNEVASNPEASALCDIFKPFHRIGPAYVPVYEVNDCRSEKFPETTPKARILAALKMLKEQANQTP